MSFVSSKQRLLRYYTQITIHHAPWSAQKRQMRAVRVSTNVDVADEHLHTCRRRCLNWSRRRRSWLLIIASIELIAAAVESV